MQFQGQPLTPLAQVLEFNTAGFNARIDFLRQERERIAKNRAVKDATAMQIAEENRRLNAEKEIIDYRYGKETEQKTAIAKATAEAEVKKGELDIAKDKQENAFKLAEEQRKQLAPLISDTWKKATNAGLNFTLPTLMYDNNSGRNFVDLGGNQPIDAQLAFTYLNEVNTRAERIQTIDELLKNQDLDVVGGVYATEDVVINGNYTQVSKTAQGKAELAKLREDLVSNDPNVYRRALDITITPKYKDPTKAEKKDDSETTAEKIPLALTLLKQENSAIKASEFKDIDVYSDTVSVVIAKIDAKLADMEVATTKTGKNKTYFDKLKQMRDTLSKISIAYSGIKGKSIDTGSMFLNPNATGVSDDLFITAPRRTEATATQSAIQTNPYSPSNF